MKRVLTSSTTSRYDHIKISLFDYAVDTLGEIDGMPLEEVFNRIDAIERYPDSSITVDDIVDYCYVEGVWLSDALDHFEDIVTN